MENLVQWYADNGAALWTTIIAFFTAYGATLVSLVVGIVKTKLANIKQSEKFTQKLDELNQAFAEMLEANKSDIIAACDANTKKRIDKINEIAESVNAKNEELEEAQPTTDALEDAASKID